MSWPSSLRRCGAGFAIIAIAAVSTSTLADAASAEPPQVTVKPSDEGLVVDVGSMGQFLLSYPAIYQQGEKIYEDAKAYKLIERKPAANTALLKYAGGAQATVEVRADHTLLISFSAMPSDVQQFRMGMLININYAQGGRFRIGAAEQAFPQDKPAKPFLYQGNANTLSLKNFEGKTISLQVPPYSYMQLSDNREWGWSTFQWWFAAPYQSGQNSYQLTITPGAGGSAGARRLVDQFGQSLSGDFPDKVKSLAELNGDIEAEKAYFATFTPPALDPYGGLPGSGEKYGLAKTGFFHVEKNQQRWILVDPAGNAFFHLGVCGFGPSDDYTYVEGREGIYEWLPPFEDPFKTAFRENDRNIVSFHLANMIRKYGAAHDIESYLTRMIERVRAWGFNSGGAFSPPSARAHQRASFPYVAHLPLAPWEGFAELPGAAGAWDPFSLRNQQQMEKLFAEKLPGRSDDPLLIGYYLVNEPLYEDLPRAIPALDGKFACKRRLVQVLREEYQTIERFNEAWGAAAKGFDELNDQGLAVSTSRAADDVNRFTRRFLELYFQLVTDAFHKHDRHHMLLGNRFQAGTINNEQLCRICGRYLDVVSFNYYTYHLDKDFLNRIYGWTGGKPMLLSEFHYNSPKDSGLIGGVKQVASQQERGLGYRNYVEQAAATGFVVGTEWFTLVDQSVSGRWFSHYNGESANTGLIAVSDRPWKAMVAEMAKTNYGIYEVLFGRRTPYVFDNPKFTQADGGRKAMAIERATGPIDLDGSAHHWPGVPAEQIPAARLVEGSVAGGVEAVFKLCWDENNLYLLARVSDPTPMRNEQRGNMIWSGDAIELFIGHDKPDQPGPLLFSDRQVFLSAGKVDGACQWHFVNVAKQSSLQMTVLRSVDGKGYILEAAVPFAALGFTPKAGEEILFDMAIDDSEDGKSRTRQLMWNGTSRNSGDRSAWGRATLTK